MDQGHALGRGGGVADASLRAADTVSRNEVAEARDKQARLPAAGRIGFGHAKLGVAAGAARVAVGGAVGCWLLVTNHRDADGLVVSVAHSRFRAADTVASHPSAAADASIGEEAVFCREHAGLPRR